jgi:hypothetical protein
MQALVFGSSFVNYEPATVSDVASIFGVTFMVIVFLGVTYFQSAIPFTSMERAVYYREQVCTLTYITTHGTCLIICMFTMCNKLRLILTTTY